MKLKDYLENLPDNILTGQKGLTGKELRILEPFFGQIDELKDKEISIVEEVNLIGEPVIERTRNGVKVRQHTDPQLVTVKGLDGLGDKIEIYSFFLQDGEIFIRCTKESSDYLEITIPPFEDIYDDGNLINQ